MISWLDDLTTGDFANRMDDLPQRSVDPLQHSPLPLFPTPQRHAGQVHILACRVILLQPGVFFL